MSALAIHRQALTPTPNAESSETDDTRPSLSALSRQPSQDHGDATNALPTLAQRLRHTSSVLAIGISDDHIFAGTQAGEILVYSLSTYERKAVIDGHKGSVLGLCLSHDQSLLFSSAGDRIVNVWNARTLKRTCRLKSSFDVGDVFCIAYSSALRTAYLGAQNTSIQWSRITRPGSKELPPAPNRFFDSKGPGGVTTPRPPGSEVTPRHATGGEKIEIAKENVRHFAHYGYVYCMLLAKEGVPEHLGQEVLVTGGGDGVIKLWQLDQETGAIGELYGLDDGREEGHAILSLAMEGTFIYCGRSGGEVDVWDLETRQLLRNIKAHRDDVLTICFGGGFLFTAAVTGYVRKFDRQYQLKNRLKAHDGRVLTSAFSWHKDRPIYATGSNDNSLAIWDVSDCISAPYMGSKTSNEQLVESLGRFVSFRTVSSDPKHKADCRRGASFLRSVFKNFGATTEMLPAEDPANPIIMAKFRGNPATAAKRKKILFYGHYDVVAATNANGKWLNDPFQMEGIDGYLYGRGTSDNKGPIMAAIFACAELASEQALNSDIIFLIEGEEECGSRGFEKAVRASKDKIGHVDWILLANSYWLDDRIPCLTYGLRGVIHATVQIESNHPDLHSGVDGSAQLDESLKDLVLLLGTLTGKGGEVKIPGFYDPVPEVVEKEAELYADITNALVQRNPDLGDPDALAASLMRRWREASLTIHRFQTSGGENATIIPRMAKAALSMRLVPNQEATVVAQALTEYLHAQFKELESNNRLSVTIDHQAEPWLGDWTNQLFKILEEAIMEAWGPIEQQHYRRKSSIAPLKVSPPPHAPGCFATKPSPTTSTVLANGSVETPLPANGLAPLTEVTNKLEEIASPPTPKHKQRRKPLYIREGGSIPAIRFLEKEFNAPAAHLPCGQASDSAHLDNERLRLVNLYKSKDIFKKVFRELPSK
ncbi:putative di- and tripeptidase DUG2 [Fulvia fulva]|nr:putative di- and tripeptidase DUG2 [Fulvia fulva]KAK4637156.1 putative di- and tripeptidase DUG2 [Fulvia fulva]WPV08790.1 putative di- and tripeptidase DUG2 [Fulvia fulva]WPV24410.1 putative di- and tripeptidase DUG2 [Fulvia fulva]